MKKLQSWGVSSLAALAVGVFISGCAKQERSGRAGVQVASNSAR